MRKFVVLALVVLMAAPGALLFARGGQEAAQVDSVEVLHWWTSGGEAAALGVLKDNLEAEGIEWIDSPIAGGGGTQAMTVLRSRATAGDPPAAVQMLGMDIIDWAELGLLANMNEIARAEGWDEVVPDAIKGFSKYDGNWIAAPVNVHSTNWVWANRSIMDELGLDIPTTWDEYIAAMDAAEAAGYVGLAHGGQAWQDGTVFEAVLASTGGPEFYKRAMIDLDDAALRSDTILKTFQRMEQLAGYLDPNFSGRDWNLASAMVIEGQALFQMMGDWAKGEFLNAGLEPGVDFEGFRTPGTQGTVLFNSDQFVMFQVAPQYRAAQNLMASAVMDPEFQIAFNTVKGSVPARTDVPDAQFESIGQAAMRELREANDAGTLHGSVAHRHGNPVQVMEAMLDVITAHFNGQVSSQAAARAFVDAVAQAR
ncbi:sugar ABC transporter substrate-binding protein [Alkalispirochaeta sphaeroplastigenens]|uniref:Probable sugar-binding periplasmic protein n=1 Tax=Alkalispirochaeta sphaeroplastigenens TaxID=1187066 RepID=A0A2S4JFU9_9SPIO|nr:ABC transporter substrate-binding protein [Alkalispirochaeta sphaeroplastigenens]POQ98392.1 sugar ABC transporter substrate-binding protein [Alkalispirochaeta sphaeroplastigenens]